MIGGAPEIGPTEIIGVVVAAVVLVITFGSLLAAGMTLLTALIGVIVGMAALILTTSVVDISSTAPVLALMLGLAVGIDYALFISSRHRTQLAEGLDEEESVARAVATAGSAVMFAGATVVIALAGLSLVGISFLTAMGLAAAGTVLTAVLVALTLLPAMLGFLGKRVLPRKIRHAAEPAKLTKEGFGFRWARFVTRFRVPVVAVGVIGLGALAIPDRRPSTRPARRRYRRGGLEPAGRLRPDRRRLRPGVQRSPGRRCHRQQCRHHDRPGRSGPDHREGPEGRRRGPARRSKRDRYYATRDRDPREQPVQRGDRRPGGHPS